MVSIRQNSYDNSESQDSEKYTYHFQFSLNGKIYVYCYIRKNACTAFKFFLVGISPHKEKLIEYQNPFDFLTSHHAIKDIQEIKKADHIIFVYRDHLERAVSLYKDKFIIRRNNVDIFRDYKLVTGESPEEATFHSFVSKYIKNEANDPHVRPQYEHLLPLVYSNAIAMQNLYTEMEHLVGKALAEKYFKSKTNSTDSFNEYSEPSSNIPARLLTERYKNEGSLPSASSILTFEIEIILDIIYHQDLKMLRQLKK